jgi:hypothetical protein
MREAAIISMARVIFLVDWTVRILCWISRRWAAGTAGGLL